MAIDADEEEEEYEEEEEEEEEEDLGEGVRVNYDSGEEEDVDRELSSSYTEEHKYKSTRSANIPVAAAKTVVPPDVLNMKEEGVDGGDFRRKLQKASNTNINTTSAFPQAKAKGEQVDFRNVLRKSGETSSVKKSVDTTAAFPQAKAKGEQVDFRKVLRKTEKKVSE